MQHMMLDMDDKARMSWFISSRHIAQQSSWSFLDAVILVNKAMYSLCQGFDLAAARGDRLCLLDVVDVQPIGPGLGRGVLGDE